MASPEGAAPAAEPVEFKVEVTPPPGEKGNEGRDAMPGESVAPSYVDLPAVAEEEQLSKMAKLGQFIYNSKTGRVLGRPGFSWLRVLVFYIVYYFFVFSYFFICILFLVQFSGENKPDMTGKSPVILSLATGLSVFPTAPKTGKASEPKERVRSSTIYYNLNEPGSCKVYSDRLDKTVKGIGGYTIPGETGDCTAANNYGYNTGQPCVLLRFNRVFDWKPNSMKNLQQYLDATYKKTDTAARNFAEYLLYLKSHQKFHEQADLTKFLDKNVGIQCMRDGGEEAAIGALTYFPGPGIEVEEYQKGVTKQAGKMKDKEKRWDWTPYILVQFKNPQRNTFIPVICKAFEQHMNLYNSREGVGAVRFSLFILDKPPPPPPS